MSELSWRVIIFVGNLVERANLLADSFGMVEIYSNVAKSTIFKSKSRSVSSSQDFTGFS